MTKYKQGFEECVSKIKKMTRNYRNYVFDKLTWEIMENKPLGSRM